MLRVRGDFNLVEEPFAAEDGGEFATENFGCDLAVALQVFGEIDGGHADRAVSELVFQRIDLVVHARDPIPTNSALPRP